MRLIQVTLADPFPAGLVVEWFYHHVADLAVGFRMVSLSRVIKTDVAPPIPPGIYPHPDGSGPFAESFALLSDASPRAIVEKILLGWPDANLEFIEVEL